MKYAIITPTFKGHFNFIKIYLKSFNKYVIDKDNVVLYFTINKNEVEDFKKIISSYTNCNIEILIFDDILKKNKIYLHPDNLLKKYGKFSFQTMKKLYSILEVPERYSLILDSESSWVRETKMSELFEQFFDHPKIFYSEINTDRFNAFCRNVQNNINIIAGHDINVWFIENFMWYYDKFIILEMIAEYGDIYSVIDKIYHKGYRMEGVFEILLYSNYIYDNNEKYRYEKVNVTEVCKKNLTPYVWENYFFDVSDRWGGSSGLLEHGMVSLNEENIEELSALFKNLGFNIIRCEVGPMNKNAKYFFEFVKPNIFAASQEHCFGVLSDKGKYEKKDNRLLAKLAIDFLKKTLKILLKKVLPGYKVACECREQIYENKSLLYKSMELSQEIYDYVRKGAGR